MKEQVKNEIADTNRLFDIYEINRLARIHFSVKKEKWQKILWLMVP